MLKLQFKPILACNMCKANRERFKTIGLRLNNSQGFRPSSKTGVGVTVMKCCECGLIFSNPQPLPFNFDDQYGMTAEEYWNTEEMEWEETYFKTEIDILKSLDFDFNKKALDVGAGYGRCMLSLEKVGMDAFGFEPAKTFYNLGINRFGLSPEKLKLATIEEIDYPNDFFDFVTFGAVLEHVHDPDFALKKALKWLKTDGLIHIEVPSAKWFTSKVYNWYYRFICRTNFVTNISPMHAPFHHFEFTRESFIKNGLINNYDIAFFKVETCSPMMPFQFLNKILKKWMQLTGSGMQLVVFLKKK